MHNTYILPGNHIDPNDKVEKKLVETLLPKYLALRLLEKTNRGNRTAILVSNTDGYGRYSESDHTTNLFAGLQYKAIIGRNAVLVDSATSAQLRDSIQDSDFGNIFVIGHANYHSWRASDKSVNWFDLGKMVDGHLKDGIFANVGCGGIHSGNMIPLGYFVVSDPKTLIGYEAEYAYGDSLGDLSKLKPLRRIPSLDSLV
jgi:hypothetical protein